MNEGRADRVIDLLESIDSTLKLMVGPIASIDKKLEVALANAEVKVVTATDSPESQLSKLKEIKEMFEEDGTLYETITRDNMLDQHTQKIQELGEKRDTLFEGMDGMLERLGTVKNILDMFAEGGGLVGGEQTSDEDPTETPKTPAE